MNRRWQAVCFLGFGLVLILVLFGSVRAFARGGNDFAVFYQAWTLVLAGRGADIYRVSPDRFLYSPGFAWLLSPLGLLPKNLALGFWCLIKGGIIAFLIQKLSKFSTNKSRLFSVGVAAWGVIMVTRPLIIDLEYGQVNLLILGACMWGLLGHFDKKDAPFVDVCSWSLLAFAALAKLFPLPLLLVPWVITHGISKKKLRRERVAIFVALAVALLIPVLSEGWIGTWNLILEWRGAVLARGLPMEAHNQSFTALLNHYFSGNPTPVLSEGAQPLHLGIAWLSTSQIILLSLFWTAFTLGINLGWILSGSRHNSIRWIAIAIALIIVPSHLIWKPYFVMSLPLAVLIVQQGVARRSYQFGFVILTLFIAINLTGFDFVGHHWAAHFEAASLLLLTHVTLILLGALAVPDTQ
jgi:hypothetical protein